MVMLFGPNQFAGESVHHPKDRGGLEFNAGETGDCIHRDEEDEDALQNEDEDEGHGLEDHEGSWR